MKKLLKNINNIDYIFKILHIWYNKCNENTFNYFFNRFSKFIILTYLNNTKNKNLVIKFLKNKDVYEDTKLYNFVVDDIIKVFDNEDNISFETFEECIY